MSCRFRRVTLVGPSSKRGRHIHRRARTFNALHAHSRRRRATSALVQRVFRRFDARLGLARTTTPPPRTGRPKMSVAPKMLTERQQLAIALRESMTAAPARVATPGSAPRPAAHSPAGDEVRAPDTSAAPPGGGCASHFQNAVARGSFLGTREHPSSSRRASDSCVRRRVDDDHAPCRAASPSVASGARNPSRKPSVASQPPCSRADRSPIRAHPDDRHSCAAYAASRKQK